MPCATCSHFLVKQVGEASSRSWTAPTARSVYFDQGNVVGAQTNVEAEPDLALVLYKFGVITTDQHDRIMHGAREGPDSRYGTAAVELGAVTQEQVFLQYLGKQIDEVVFATLKPSVTERFFLDGFDESRLVAHHRSQRQRAADGTL